MVASHEQIAHEISKPDIHLEQDEHAHSHADHYSSTSDESYDHHQDAHSSIGHLLAHMPISLFETPTFSMAQLAEPAPEFLYAPLVHRYLEPPLPPPKIVLPY